MKNKLKILTNKPDKKNWDCFSEIYLPVNAYKVCCHMQEQEFDIFSNTVLDFMSLQVPPTIYEIANMMGLSISTIENILNHLKDQKLLNYDNSRNWNKVLIQKEIKSAYIFQNRLTNELLPFVYFKDEIEIDNRKENNLNNYKEPESRQLEALKHLYNSHNEVEIVNLALSEKISDCFINLNFPLFIYFEKGELMWKVRNPFSTEFEYSIEIKEVLNNGKIKQSWLQDKINSLCEKNIKASKTDLKYDEVINEFGDEIIKEPYYAELCKANELIYNFSDNLDTKIREIKRCYVKLNKILEVMVKNYLISNNKSINAKDKNLKSYIKYLPEEIKGSYSCRFKEFYKNRSISSHADDQNISSKDLLLDWTMIKDFYRDIYSVETNEIANIKRIIPKSNEDYKKMRIIVEEKSYEWDFLPEKILIDYAFSEITSDSVAKGIFIESVLKWYIQNYNFYDFFSKDGWRKTLRSISENLMGSEICEELCKTRTQFVKKALNGDVATLGAYAVAILLSRQPEGNEELQKVLGQSWFEIIPEIIINRKNHA